MVLGRVLGRGLGSLGVVVAGCVVALPVVPAAAAPASTPAAGSTPAATDTDPLLPQRMRGSAALRELGTEASTAAARNEMSSTEFRQTVRKDPAVRVGRPGLLMYVDRAPAGALEAESAGQPATATAAASYPLSDTFNLHSRPGSNQTVFLDFDGVTLAEETLWDRDGTDVTGVHAGYSLDADPTFSDAERRIIQDTWARVAEDYAPFDVDVTTEDPGVAALTRTSTSDPTYGTHVVFTPSDTRGLCNGCAGIAWVGTFDGVGAGFGAEPGPAWVFTGRTGGTSFDFAEVGSHEAGHTFGLQHDGTSGGSYYSGQGVWGAIMGSARYPLTQFSIGDYAGASNGEDDLALIAGAGAPAVADDYPDTLLGGAPGSLGDGASGVVDGLIGDRGDVDLLTYSHGACPVTITVATASPGPNLDVGLVVRDASGAVVGSASPTTTRTTVRGEVLGTGASLTTPALPAGTLTVEIDGVGQGDPLAGGHSDYGSVGRWTATVSGCAADQTGTTEDTGVTDPPTETPITPTVVVTTPDRPAVLGARSGRPGGRATAAVRWAAPTSDGGSPVTGYRVAALKVDDRGHIVRRVFALRPAWARAWAPRLTQGQYRFVVRALNDVGAGPRSARSARVVAR